MCSRRRTEHWTVGGGATNHPVLAFISITSPHACISWPHAPSQRQRTPVPEGGGSAQLLTAAGKQRRRRRRHSHPMATEDVCLVCADPLDWTGFGTCGHKDACSRCVARLRFVLEDNKCVICREPSLAVFFTRFSGDYTARLTPAQFALLPVRPWGFGLLWEKEGARGHTRLDPACDSDPMPPRASTD
jgi:hypothetical protein